MSFFARTQPIILIKQATRTTTPYAARTFTASATHQKGVVDTAKDALKAVDRRVSDKLVDGIEVTGKPASSLLTSPCRYAFLVFVFVFVLVRLLTWILERGLNETEETSRVFTRAANGPSFAPASYHITTHFPPQLY